MKLLDQFLTIDRFLVACTTFLVLIGLVGIVIILRDRSLDRSKSSSIIVNILLILLGFYSASLISLPYQIGQVANINYGSNSITFNVKNGDKIKYKYNASSKEYSSTNNTAIEGINEIMGRYDFTYIKEIEQTGSKEWLVTFKCDCGKVKSVTIGE